MFENLLHQEEAASFLSGAVARKALPPSLLFHGPWCSGKTTAALELARALSCPSGAQWNCPCPSCERHRRLTHPDILLMGPDSFAQEIGAALSMISSDSPKRELYAFIRAIRRLSKRFDPALWAGEESKLSKALIPLESIEEILADLDPGSPGSDPLESAKKVAAEAAKLIPLVPQGIPISQVRAAAAWSRYSPSGPRKVLILENADLMLEASRNALLKLIEEPPASLVVVLCTERRQAMMETILSRLRPIAFRDRNPPESEEVLQRIFSHPAAPAAAEGGLNGIAAFLESFSPFDSAASAQAARAFLGSLGPILPQAHPLAGYLPSDSGQQPLDGRAMEKPAFPGFCSSILSELSAIMKKGATSPDAILALERWSRSVTEASQRASVQNQNPEALLPWLYREISST